MGSKFVYLKDIEEIYNVNLIRRVYLSKAGERVKHYDRSQDLKKEWYVEIELSDFSIYTVNNEALTFEEAKSELINFYNFIKSNEFVFVI